MSLVTIGLVGRVRVMVRVVFCVRVLVRVGIMVMC